MTGLASWLPAPFRLTCVWANLGLLGVVFTLAVLVATPLLRPDLNLFERALSYYAIGPWGIVQSLAFVAMGVASIAIGIACLWAGPASRWLPLSVSMLIISGIASMGLVMYPMSAEGPTTFIGDAHQTAGTVGGVAQLVAALAFALALRGKSVWGALFPPAIAAFAVAAVGALLTQVAIWWPDLDIPIGATSRTVVIPLIALWGATALRLRRVCRRPPTRSAAAR